MQMCEVMHADSAHRQSTETSQDLEELKVTLAQRNTRAANAAHRSRRSERAEKAAAARDGGAGGSGRYSHAAALRLP